MTKMLPLPMPSTKGKGTEMYESNIKGLLMNLAKDQLEDGTSSPNMTDSGTITPAPTEKEASTTPPASTCNEAGMTADKPTNPKHKGTRKPDQPPTTISNSSNSNDGDTEDEQYLSYILEWIGLDPDFKRMLDDESKMLAHYNRILGNKAIPMFQYAVMDNAELFTELWEQISAAIYTMCEAIVPFNTWLANISDFGSGQCKRMADTNSCNRKQVPKE
jgi:hypothetical protein